MNLFDIPSTKLVKALGEGDSSTGKTTSLISLIAAGYKLRIWNYDNKLDSLVAYTRLLELEPDVQVATLRDNTRPGPNGPILDGPPKAFSTGLDLMDKWLDGTKPATWGKDHVVVLDTLTSMSIAARNWAMLMASALSYTEGIPQKGIDGRNLIYVGQQAILNMIRYLTAEWFNTNVLVLSHIKYFDRPDGTKAYPVTLGSAIAAEIPASFNSIFQYETTTLGGVPSRVLRTVSTPMIDLQNPVSFKMPSLINIPELKPGLQPKALEDTGVAKFFSIVRSL
jgi:hypothetical protein